MIFRKCLSTVLSLGVNPILLIKMSAFTGDSIHIDQMYVHSVEVVSKIATTFISIRLKHFAKQENERIKRNRLRKKLSKLVHFNNQ